MAKKREKWTDEKINFLQENWGKMTIQEIGDHLNMDVSTIYKKKKTMGLKRPIKWTEEKIQLLKEHYPTDTWEELFQLFPDTSKDGIRAVASDYKIPRNVYNDCHRTDEEINFILNNYENMTASEMGRHLNRPILFIMNILNDNNLKPASRPGHLKEEDEELFKQLYPKYTNIYLSEKFFPYLNRHQLRVQAKRFGLVKECHGGLGLQITVCRDQNGNLCLSETERLISDFLINNNISFIKEALYKEVIPVEECGKKRFDWKIGDKYIEYFGLIDRKFYKEKANIKINLCKKYSIDLLSLYPEDMNNQEVWQTKILQFIKEI